jgi:hypothetical protein
MRRLITVIALAASAALAAGPAWAAGAHTTTVAVCRASGAQASCIVTATIRHPGIIRAHATARPAQHVSVTWSMTCTSGKSSKSATGSFTAKTPVSRILPHPFRHPSSCKVTATTRLAKTGHLHAWLTAQNS